MNEDLIASVRRIIYGVLVGLGAISPVGCITVGASNALATIATPATASTVIDAKLKEHGA